MDLEVHANSVFVASSDLVSADLSTEAESAVVILALDGGVYYELNDVGTRIWQLLQSPRPLAELVAAILAEYDVDSARCEHDIRALIADLIANGLVETRPGVMSPD
ncbi:PqqD family protein [Thiococcus pfennigii]|jgi:hypothetical protein|uniref:PqqD family protein n=1 Tax=Thiococcus pfennigii TaxID=1057 RepID=UPI001908AECE|nr:PqqD family protein [Thiococcus pfennigii]MBK1699560.1 hypothetical protein [Thiococcus pfennigii]MBK1731485.1 hypothetical protein [Thiococcus pfennigii]